MQTPNITQAQIATVVAALVAVLGVVQTAPQRLQVPLLVGIAVIAVAWIVGDAVIRYGRSGIEASRVAARHAADSVDGLPEIVKVADGDDDVHMARG